MKKLKALIAQLFNDPSPQEFLGREDIETTRDIDILAYYWDSEDFDLFAYDHFGRHLIARDEAVDEFGSALYERYELCPNHPILELDKKAVENYYRSW